MPRSFLIIIDGLGVGAQEDAEQYGDEQADTLGNVSRITNVQLPNFEKLGMGNIREFRSIKPVNEPLASYGKMRMMSAGKDSTTGHWEFAGIHLERPFPVYPEGFPDEIIKRFCSGIGIESVLCNLPCSGTRVINEYGIEHMETGLPIVYTSADSVFQIACHSDIIPVKKLYEWCEYAREFVMVREHAVGRVIARPFYGKPGSFERLSDQRHDYSLKPPVPNLMTELLESGIKTYSIGKIIDLFANKGFTQFRRTKSNAEGIAQLLSLMSSGIDNSFSFINLIDTDQIYGHRQDTKGFATCLQEIDRAIPKMVQKLNDGDLMIISGDHGNDPADDSTDHTREFVPVLSLKKGAAPGKNLGIRDTFSDVSAAILEMHGIDNKLKGTSFFEVL